MNSIERIERATETPEYKTYGAMAGAALAGAIFAPNKAAQGQALKQYGELIAKQAEVVRRG
jgi:hypothetical protein